MEIMPKYGTVKDVSRLTGIPTGTLYEWAVQRFIPSLKVGGKVMFDLAEIDEWMQSHKRTSTFNKNQLLDAEPAAGYNSTSSGLANTFKPPKGGKDV